MPKTKASAEPPAPATPSKIAQLRGVAKLATQATLGAAKVAEGVHQSVWRSMGVPGGKSQGQTRGITGMVYQAVGGITRLAGAGADAALSAFEPLMQHLDAEDRSGAQATNTELAVLAALNGVMGDQLAADNNPLATPMALRHQGLVLAAASQPDAAQVNGRLVVLIHGLCMNDLQWASPEAKNGQDLGASLAAVGYTPIYLRYNTGLHISENGALLAEQLAMLAAHWPAPITELSVVAHSMGGLVTRSALHVGERDQAPWTALVKKLVFLGSPHHGAPLEQAGNWVDVMLGTSMYSRPFKHLAQLRSAGITDLRHGNVLDADWQGRERFARGSDPRTPLPLPNRVACHAVAGTLAKPGSVVSEKLLGDGLVPVESALGKHSLREHSLAFKAAHTYLAHNTGHMALLHSAQVREKVLTWMA